MSIADVKVLQVSHLNEGILIFWCFTIYNLCCGAFLVVCVNECLTPPFIYLSYLIIGTELVPELF